MNETKTISGDNLLGAAFLVFLLLLVGSGVAVAIWGAYA